MIYRDKEWLRQRYWGEGLRRKQMAQLAGCAEATIQLWMNKHGIPSRPKGFQKGQAPHIERKRHWHLAFFESWSQELAYVLGFAFADGTVGRGGLHISQNDKEILMTIALVAGGNEKMVHRFLQTREGTPYYRLDFAHRDLPRILAKYGLYSNKSLTMRWPTVPNEYLGSFVRGYFDGDGSVNVLRLKTPGARYHGVVISFTSGSAAFLHDLSTTLAQHGLSQKRVLRAKPMQEAYSLAYGATQDIWRLAQLMYRHAIHWPSLSSLYLSSKREALAKAMALL